MCAVHFNLRMTQDNRAQTGETEVKLSFVISCHTCCKTQTHLFQTSFSQFLSWHCFPQQRLSVSSQTNFSLSTSLHAIIRTRKASQVRNEIAEACYFWGNEHKWLIKAIESPLPVVSGGCYLWSSGATEDFCGTCSCGAWVQLVTTGVLFPSGHFKSACSVFWFLWFM